MSGGHFDYNQYRIESIAEEISYVIEDNDSTELDDFGYEKGHHYPPEVIERFKLALKTLKKAAIMTQRIDWLLSGDDGEEDFIQRWDEELSKCL